MKWINGGTAMTVVFAVGLLAIPRNGQAQTYSGEAAVVTADVLGLAKVSIEDTGNLPKGGGSLSTELLSAEVPGLLDLSLLSATTTGAGNVTNSKASVANVTLTAAGVYITASVLTSTATASCQPGQASVTGSSTVAALTVNGLSVTVTGQPNQTIPLIVGSLIINEQISSTTVSSNLSAADIVVNALHLKVNIVADVVISSSHAGMTCQGGGIGIVG